MLPITGHHTVADPSATTEIKRPALPTSSATISLSPVWETKFHADQPTPDAAQTSTPTADAGVENHKEFVKIIQALTTHEYGAHLGLASGIHTYVRAMYSSKEYNNLMMAATPFYVEQMYSWLYYFSTLPFDPKYANPYDDAMATLVVFLLNYTLQTPVRKYLVNDLVRDAKNCFWLWKVLQDPTL